MASLLDGKLVEIYDIVEKNLQGKVLISSQSLDYDQMANRNFDKVALYDANFENTTFKNTTITDFYFETVRVAGYDGRFSDFSPSSLGDAYFEHIHLLDHIGLSFNYPLETVGWMVERLGPEHIGAITLENIPLWELLRETEWEEGFDKIMRGLLLYGPTPIQLEEYYAELGGHIYGGHAIDRWFPWLDKKGYLAPLVEKAIIPIWAISPKIFSELSAEGKVACLNNGYKDDSLEQEFKDLFGEG